MPLWRIYAHPTTFTKEQKAGLAAAITKLYVDPPVSLPAFYVNVLFVPLQEDEIWIGGETRKNFVRITIEQIARTMDNADTEEGRGRRKWWMDNINAVCCDCFARRVCLC
jgi:phenylpyruvate tautomerase PptA (4-oxalocrotonate tautomerase family)